METWQLLTSFDEYREPAHQTYCENSQNPKIKGNMKKAVFRDSFLNSNLFFS